jgi:hypothetical protein
MFHGGGHLSGLQHEIQQTDRNNYITVNFANVSGRSTGTRRWSDPIQQHVFVNPSRTASFVALFQAHASNH